jgi:hypothetical protein
VAIGGREAGEGGERHIVGLVSPKETYISSLDQTGSLKNKKKMYIRQLS